MFVLNVLVFRVTLRLGMCTASLVPWQRVLRAASVPGRQLSRVRESDVLDASSSAIGASMYCNLMPPAFSTPYTVWTHTTPRVGEWKCEARCLHRGGSIRFDLTPSAARRRAAWFVAGHAQFMDAVREGGKRKRKRRGVRACVYLRREGAGGGSVFICCLRRACVGGISGSAESECVYNTSYGVFRVRVDIVVKRHGCINVLRCLSSIFVAANCVDTPDAPRW